MRANGIRRAHGQAVEIEQLLEALLYTYTPWGSTSRANAGVKPSPHEGINASEGFSSSRSGTALDRLSAEHFVGTPAFLHEIHAAESQIGLQSGTGPSRNPRRARHFQVFGRGPAVWNHQCVKQDNRAWLPVNFDRQGLAPLAKSFTGHRGTTT